MAVVYQTASVAERLSSISLFFEGKIEKGIF